MNPLLRRLFLFIEATYLTNSFQTSTINGEKFPLQNKTNFILTNVLALRYWTDYEAKTGINNNNGLIPPKTFLALSYLGITNILFFLTGCFVNLLRCDFNNVGDGCIEK